VVYTLEDELLQGTIFAMPDLFYGDSLWYEEKTLFWETSWNALNSRRKRRHMAIFCFVLFGFFFLSLLTRSTLPFHAFLLHDSSVSIILPRRNFSNIYRRLYRCVPLTRFTKSIQPLQVFWIVKKVLSLITGTYFKPRWSLSGTKVQTCKKTVIETFTILIRIYFTFSRPMKTPAPKLVALMRDLKLPPQC